jgi:urease accessory protein
MREVMRRNILRIDARILSKRTFALGEPSRPSDARRVSFAARMGASLAAVAALIQLFPPVVLAHPGHLGHGFADGALHPLAGLDHLLAMVAVGLLAARLGGRAVWMLPGGFMTAMLAGGLLGSIGAPLPAVEFGIGASVLVLGLMVALRSLLPLVASLVLVAVFAVFHGHAHAAEMAAEGSFGLYAAGFLVSTALLHASGVVGALLVTRHWTATAVRLGGAAISVASLAIFLG